MERLDSEVIVIGAGLAGIVASLELLAAGKRVALLDRDIEANFGGLAKESFGGILAVGTREQRRAGITDTPDLALADWISFGELDAAETWPRRWAEAYVNECHDEVYLWLKERGIGFLPIPHWVERGQAQRGNSVPRWHIVWGTGQELIRQLLERLRSHPRREALALHFGQRVEELMVEDRRVVGCRGRSEASGRPFEARAGAVIVASGGINGSLERVRAHWHADWRKPPATLLNGSHAFADGTLHDAVQAVGGRVTHLDRMWNYAGGVHHWRPRKPDHGLSLVPPRSALWLNWRGDRLLPPLVTGFDTRDLVTRVCAEDRQYSWQLLNRRIALKELAVSGAEFNPSIRDKKKLAFLRDMFLGNRWLVDQLRDNCIDVLCADTLPELVRKMNALQGDEAIDCGRLVATVVAYDAQVVLGEHCQDEQVQRIAQVRKWRGDRLRTCGFQKILEPQAGPLFAIREFIVSRKSLGGMQTDLDCRVLDAAGDPITGLYAAGEAAGFGGGGMNGLRALEGTFLGGCIHNARRAARAISQ